MVNEVTEFYNNIFGTPALAKFVDVGQRKGHSPEHTIAAAQMVYEMHKVNPFNSPKIMGHMIHATASRLHRERVATELDILELITGKIRRTFWDKLDNWMRWGKWQ